MRLYRQIRPWAVKAGATSWGHAAGKTGYWWIASALSEQWAKREDVNWVGIRGGMLRGVRVGISDIDVTLHLRHLTVTGLLRWRQSFERERHLWGVLGEPVLVTPTAWNKFWALAPATTHWYLHHRRWSSGGWTDVHEPPPPSHPGSRFAFAWDLFRLALKANHRWHRHQDGVARGVAARNLEKLARYLGVATPRIKDVWAALDALAGTVPTEVGGIPVRRRAEPDPLSESLREHFRTRSGVNAEATSVPLVWRVAPREDLHCRFNHWRREHPRVPPVYLITPQMEQVLRQGWTAWSPRQPLPGLDWWTGTGRVGTQMKQSIRERLANDLVSLPGRYLWFTNGAFESELKRVALEALHLRLDHFRSGRSLWLKARRELEPALVALFLRAVTPGADAAATALELCRWIRDEMLEVSPALGQETETRN